MASPAPAKLASFISVYFRESTIPGTPAYVAKASQYTRKTASWGLKDVDLQGHNAIQGTFRFAA